MTKTFTKDDLVRMVYQEVNEDEQLHITQAMATNEDFQACADHLESTKSMLEGLLLKAPKEVIAKILFASKNLQSA